MGVGFAEPVTPSGLSMASVVLFRVGFANAVKGGLHVLRIITTPPTSFAGVFPQILRIT